LLFLDLWTRFFLTWLLPAAPAVLFLVLAEAVSSTASSAFLLLLSTYETTL